MAEHNVSEVASELNKLKKPELINLIIYKKLPLSFQSEVLSGFLHLSSDSGDVTDVDPNFTESESKLCGNGNDGCAGENCSVVKMKYEFCLREIEFKDQILKHLNDRIVDLELIIKLLRNQDQIDRKSGGEKVMPSSSRPHKCTENKGTSDNLTKVISGDKVVNNNKKDSSRKLIPQHSNSSQTNLAVKTTTSTGGKIKNAMNSKEAVKFSFRDIILGNRDSDGESLKAVPQVGYIHVYRLDPGTSEQAVSEYLKQFIPDCKCEILNSKHPEVYSSFKITVPLNDVEKVMNPNVWPVGTRVNRYFHRHSATKGPT